MKFNKNQFRHLTHPFYKEADQYREDVRVEQILKGADKYPNPFSPEDWTSADLVRHAMQENVDQAHYIYGLYSRIVELEKALDFYAQKENHNETHRSIFNSEYYQSNVMIDGGATARKALGYTEED